MKNQTCQTCGVPSFGKNCRVCFTEPEPLEEKFWRHVRNTSRCWIWTGNKSTRGYGRLLVGSKTDDTRRFVQATRISWEIHHGTPPRARFLYHRCRKPACVRPEHLFPSKGRVVRGRAR